MSSISIQSATGLLNQADRIIRESLHRELLRGEFYNIFSVLGIAKKEEVHSRIIADLLNPQGHHRQGVRFLETFITRLKQDFQDLSSVDGEEQGPNLLKKLSAWAGPLLENTWVKREHHLGPVNNERYEGGYIDIVLRLGPNSMILENKIDAGDQEGQLKRYSKLEKADHRIIFYLSNGQKPSKDSTVDLEEHIDFHCLTYVDHILPWLEDCLREVTLTPLLRENIRQYIIIIKRLTKQLEPEMQKELDQLIIKNISTVEALSKSLTGAKKRFRQEVLKQLQNTLDEFKDKIGYSLKIHSQSGKDLEKDIFIIKFPNWQAKEEKGVPFVKYNVKDFLFGEGPVVLECVDRTGKHLGLKDRNSFEILDRREVILPNDLEHSQNRSELLTNPNKGQFLLDALVQELVKFIRFTVDEHKLAWPTE